MPEHSPHTSMPVSFDLRHTRPELLQFNFIRLDGGQTAGNLPVEFGPFCASRRS